MRLRNILLSAASVAALGGAAGQAQANPFYVSVFGGANWIPDKSAHTSYTSRAGLTFTHTGSLSESFRTGFVLGGAVGVHLTNWVEGLRAELEASYRRNHVHGNWATHITTHSGGEGRRTTSAHGTLDGHISTFAVLANVWYDIDLGSRLHPYVGAGAGWARSRIAFQAVTTTFNNSTSDFGDERSGFAYQLGVGLNYDVMPGTQIGIGYRYFRAPSLDPFFDGKEGTVIRNKITNENHSVELSLTLGID